MTALSCTFNAHCARFCNKTITIHCTESYTIQIHTTIWSCALLDCYHFWWIFKTALLCYPCTKVRLRALEKVDKQQLNRKRFEIYQTISCFWAFLVTLSLHNFTKNVSKSVKLTTFIEMIIKSNLVKFLLRLQTKIYMSSSSPSLTYFQVQLFPVSGDKTISTRFWWMK